jgi:hypothetical protein
MAADFDPEAGGARDGRRRGRGGVIGMIAGGLLALGVTDGARAEPPQRTPAGCFGGAPAPAPSGTLTAAGDIALAGGAAGRLAGLAPSTVDAAALARLLAAMPAEARAAAGREDRWGRLPVEVVAGGVHLAAALLSDGQAAVRPGELPAACTRSLLGIEDQARRAGRGRWAAGGVLDAADGRALAALEGRFVLAEGRVTGLGRTSSRLYLNFGGIRGQSFAVSVPTRALQKFEASGMRLVTLEGRRIRVRGVVVGQGGPRVEVALPEEIERLD